MDYYHCCTCKGVGIQDRVNPLGKLQE
jgi:hypothetical protein